MGLETCFNSTIIGCLNGIHCQSRQNKFSSQFFPEFFGNIRHGIKMLNRFQPKPFIDLFGPEFFLPDLFKILFQFGQAKVPDIFDYCFCHAAKITNCRPAWQIS